jgi:hypothetical protein
MRNKSYLNVSPVMSSPFSAAGATQDLLPKMKCRLRLTVIALAVTATMPVWAQDPLNSGNSNLPTTSPRVFSAKVGDIDYATNAQVGLIRVMVAQNSLPADGQTPARLAITVLDFNGQPLKGDAIVTIEASGGRIQIPGAATDELNAGRKDVDRVTRGTQLKVTDGRGEILLLAPYQPQDVTVRITAGKAQAQGVISFVPELRVVDDNYLGRLATTMLAG